MKGKYLSAGLLIVFMHVGCTANKKDEIDSVFSNAAQQTEYMLKEVELAKQHASKPDLLFPRTLSPSGSLELVAAGDWTSGFFAGVLWFLYEQSKDDKWLALARQYTTGIEKEKMNGRTHDMGFKIYNSFGSGYRLTGDTAYKQVIIQSAKTLSTRYNPNTGVTRSWDHNKAKWTNPVIIDNMMNLELLFEASLLTGDSSFYNIAVSHADQTIKNHFRDDYSSYHVVDYDPQSGDIIKKTTHQGYSDDSAWARGQAWALYGYVMCYRYTKHSRYLQQAEHIASYILNHPNMPEDLVPYWDFDAPNIPNEPRDASAAAIIASGLYELSGYSEKENYKEIADKIISNLTASYRSSFGENKGFLLLHSTGSKPSNLEVDVPLNYADYYYLEALLRKDRSQ
ncbi:glycoside hydrolase family 88 protein [Sphingobacterium sp. JB170]|uniref:glycoside hydrolase family 88 protein n=1 Tax=Sphingobacterium sp. JB170 TaxID=1434842 RepID=UPI00097EABA0|nr:glycoside hydrolase family 88 protein [Sphingobacterium sp. JB170]SJN46667.1 Glucuronyl hydrolase [Sphingobacterium sp. JB170]